jgi:hypothetical protein
MGLGIEFEPKRKLLCGWKKKIIVRFCSFASEGMGFHEFYSPKMDLFPASFGGHF